MATRSQQRYSEARLRPFANSAKSTHEDWSLSSLCAFELIKPVCCDRFIGFTLGSSLSMVRTSTLRCTKARLRALARELRSTERCLSRQQWTRLSKCPCPQKQQTIGKALTLWPPTMNQNWHLEPGACKKAIAADNCEWHTNNLFTLHPSQHRWTANERADGTKEYRGCEESLKFLIDTLQHDTYVGILGFSQGAAMVGLLSAWIARPHLHPLFAEAQLRPFEFAVCVAGFASVDPAHQSAWAEPVPGRVLHVLGRGDGIVAEDRTLPFIKKFGPESRVEWHDGCVVLKTSC